MKKYGHMMYPNQRKASGAKKLVCAKCEKPLTPTTACYYVDGCNVAITNSAPPYCIECYKTIYH